MGQRQSFDACGYSRGRLTIRTRFHVIFLTRGEIVPWLVVVPALSATARSPFGIPSRSEVKLEGRVPHEAPPRHHPFMTKFSGALCALLVMAGVPVAYAQTSLYATGTGGIYTINTATGATTALGAPTDANLASGGLAYDSANSTLYATGLDGSSQSAFYSLNTSTGAATKIAQISGGYSFDTGGLAYDSTHNVLYATATNGGSSTSLFGINPGTGATSLIATTTTTTSTSSTAKSPVAIANLQNQLLNLQNQLFNVADVPTQTSLFSDINAVTNNLNAARTTLNASIATLNSAIQTAVNNGVPGVPSVTVQPISPTAITQTDATTTHNFTLLGLGYKATTDTLFANGMIGGTSTSTDVTTFDASGHPQIANSISSTGGDSSGQGSVVFTLNRSSGAPTSLGYAGVSSGSSFSSGGLDFDPVTGALYAIGSVTGSTDGLYTINTSTGHATLVAAFSPGIGALGGLAFAPTAIPEPSTYAALFGLAALGFAASSRRRKLAG
jgi:hypothetical protein